MRNDYEPFENAEQVWFWFCGCLMVREEGGLRSRGDYAGKPRKCEIADIYRIVKKNASEPSDNQAPFARDDEMGAAGMSALL